MNAIVGKIAQDHTSRELCLDDAHLWRSKLVEKCAEAERCVIALLQAAGKTSQAKAPLSQKIETLKKTLDDSAKADAKLLALLEQLRPCSDLRSDLVHSTISIAVIEDENVAVVRSASEQHEGAGTRLLMKLACLKARYDETSGIVNRLRQAADARQKAGFPLSRE